MRSLILTTLLAATALDASPSGRSVGQEIDNVTVFARLYGVVRYFYPSDAAADLDWDRFAVHGVKVVRAAPDPRQLEAALNALFSPLGPGLEIATIFPKATNTGIADRSLIAWRYLGAGMAAPDGYSPYRGKRTNRPIVAGAKGAPNSAPQTASGSDTELFESVGIRGAHADVDLGSHLRARVQLALTESEAGAPKHSPALARLRAAVDRVPASPEALDRDSRLAAVVVAWNVFRHFYPYWAEAGVDWDARLPGQLELSYVANTRKAQSDALRQLVADARDGHGRVVDRRSGARARLPIQLGFFDGQLVVTASGIPAAVPVGAAVSTIDGQPAAERLADAMRLASGTTQWKRARALREMTTCDKATVVSIIADAGTGPTAARLECTDTQPPAESRPAPVAELPSGIWYVDLTRAPMTDITPVLQKLSRAVGVVFDVRGYPTDAGARILPHLIEGAETDRWMHVAKLIGPFGQSAGWQSFGWNMRPATPRLAGRIVFLTDGSAISYAESVMGYVADRKLGTIIGSTTAGTNGNVATFHVPGDFTIAFTGMRVTRHDGQASHHLVGVKPDIQMVPTLAGLRDGRDELLDRALGLIQGK